MYLKLQKRLRNALKFLGIIGLAVILLSMKRMMRIRVSKNFFLDEMGLDNSSPILLKCNAKLLISYVLQPIRNHFGGKVIIASGYRTPQKNKAVGGVPNSQHLEAKAADIKVYYNDGAQVPPRIVADFISRTLNFDVLILYTPGATPNYPKGGVHVSFSLENNRKIFKTK